jgi:hypothetical protein
VTSRVDLLSRLVEAAEVSSRAEPCAARGACATAWATGDPFWRRLLATCPLGWRQLPAAGPRAGRGSHSLALPDEC